MNNPSDPAPNTPSPDRTRWTGEKAARFLKLLAEHGQVARAARSVGMSRQAAYRLRARAPKFAEYWELAMQDARLDKWTRRAQARGVRKPVHPLLARGPGR
ncbi:hypothetical protein [Erythrobacter litoralis]|uniref:LysR family transcriptional regulator n=1 Tax=Erythrobacter litoralis (strain HTCC2594) TaxID=314225 RepID=Q2N8E8_ERYLH|nr:hypothetical protein [Erythrobacter litoralis]ABC64043.1 hypothetical protein ELI_09755 [Erythrobacter litoralis HTCC2594]